VQNFLQLLIGGMSLGAVYALLALGFVVIFKATGVINFAHPALLMVGAYFTSRFRVAGELPFGVALLLGIGVAVAVALAVERLLVRNVRVTTSHAVIAVSIMTIGVDVLLQTEMTRRIGIDVLPMGDPWGNRVVTVAGLTIPETRLIALGVGIAVIAGFLTWFRFSTWGVAMRATAEDPATASLMGIARGRISATSWMIAGALAAIAGLFITVFPSPGLEPATSAVALRAFPAAIIGGLDSTGGAVVGGLLIGVTEALTQGYAGHLAFLGTGFHTVMPYLVMVLVLLARPTGLFGTKELHRV
jgi:branched-chain amino acid transport system permease protein